MTLDNLLEFWADWRCGRRTKSYFAASRLNLLMAGETLTGGSRLSALPYGIDPDDAGAAIDREICRLPPMQQKVVFAEYGSQGTQAWKAGSIAVGRKRGITHASYRRLLCEAKKRLKSQPLVVRLLEKA